MITIDNPVNVHIRDGRTAQVLIAARYADSGMHVLLRIDDQTEYYTPEGNRHLSRSHYQGFARLGNGWKLTATDKIFVFRPPADGASYIEYRDTGERLTLTVSDPNDFDFFFGGLEGVIDTDELHATPKTVRVDVTDVQLLFKPTTELATSIADLQRPIVAYGDAQQLYYGIIHIKEYLEKLGKPKRTLVDNGRFIPKYLARAALLLAEAIEGQDVSTLPTAEERQDYLARALHLQSIVLNIFAATYSQSA